MFASIPIVWVSRSSLRDVQLHGFYRFFAWEIILIMFLTNMDYWFVDPFSLRQIISWLFLTLSLVLLHQGVQLFRRKGKIDPERNDQGLVGIEKTTELVTTGVYHYIRHPFYSSLLFLGWGIFLKNTSWISILLAVTTTMFLTITARKEEVENIQYFGEKYQEYIKHTKMFIPFIF
ncbi:MAG: isoprenylcysteine carboxylmethyltransferase family protein [Deltaproteobacteria bacterium]|nr:MAG: isoprenylcysteine carboxylmethyltransferase family protein [Deltaproteobacteria bacterium]